MTDRFIRNEPCHCGSGKKHKQCRGPNRELGASVEGQIVNIRLFDVDCHPLDQYGTAKERQEIRELGMVLEDAVLQDGTGSMAHCEFGSGWATLSFYGTNSAAILKSTWPVLITFPCREGSHVLACRSEIVPSTIKLRETESHGRLGNRRAWMLEGRTEMPLREGVWTPVPGLGGDATLEAPILEALDTLAREFGRKPAPADKDFLSQMTDSWGGEL